MHNPETKQRFIDLRAQSWSLAKISTELNVPISTLSEWNIRYRPQIHQLRISHWEEMEERLECSHDTRLQFLLQTYKHVEAALAGSFKRIQYCNLEQLMKMAASLRAEIYKLQFKIGRFNYSFPPQSKPEFSGKIPDPENPTHS